MFSLIMNETCFTMKQFSHQVTLCLNHDRNVHGVVSVILRIIFKHFAQKRREIKGST